MANEITTSATLSYLKNSFGDSLAIGPLSVSVSGSAFTHGRQSVGTTEEALNLGDVSGEGWIIIVNRDASNYVELKQSGGAVNPYVKIKPGEFACFRNAGYFAPYARANVAACDVEYLVVSN